MHHLNRGFVLSLTFFHLLLFFSIAQYIVRGLFVSCSSFDLDKRLEGVGCVETNDHFAVRNVESLFSYACREQNRNFVCSECLNCLNLLVVFLLRFEHQPAKFAIVILLLLIFYVIVVCTDAHIELISPHPVVFLIL